jgi:general secretion pathway protein E
MTMSEAKSGTPVIDLNKYPIQPEALRLIPETMARKYNVIPLAVENGSLLVGMAQADDIYILEALGAQARMRIQPALVQPDQIQQAIDLQYQAYKEIEKHLNQAIELEEKGKAAAGESSNQAVVKALSQTIEEAVKHRASDIHIEPQQDHLRVRYRIDGVLHEKMSLPLSVHGSILTRIKVLANLNIADHRPQDGQFSHKIRDREVDIRVGIVPTTYGEMAVMRILDKKMSALQLSQVGFSPRGLATYENMLKCKYGMILVAGPTGSGKTTTLYASINQIDRKGRKVITIEDPVEYRFKDINQIQVNPRTGLTFAAGLRSVLRLDPDVILVGEIRDPETAEIAVQAALTGHLVLSSIHANNAVSALFRLLDLGIGRFLIPAAVIGIVSQRMVRRVCPHCARPAPAPPPAQRAYFNELGENRVEFMYGAGCNACSQTGFLGRTATLEILTINSEIGRAILDGASADEIRAKAIKSGMVPMWRDAMLKAKAGITTPDEVLRNIFSIDRAGV